LRNDRERTVESLGFTLRNYQLALRSPKRSKGGSFEGFELNPIGPLAQTDESNQTGSGLFHPIVKEQAFQASWKVPQTNVNFTRGAKKVKRESEQAQI
jgi:hypothetical protein